MTTKDIMTEQELLSASTMVGLHKGAENCFVELKTNSIASEFKAILLHIEAIEDDVIVHQTKERITCGDFTIYLN